MTDNMPKQISAYINGQGLGCFEMHPNIPLTTEYIRADVAGKTVVIKSDMAHELKAAIEFYEGVIKELKAQIVSLQMQQEDGR